MATVMLRRWFAAGCLACAITLLAVQARALAGDRLQEAAMESARLMVKSVFALCLAACVFQAARGSGCAALAGGSAQPRWQAWRWAVLAAATGASLIVAATQRAPSRMAITLVCYALASLPALWAAGSRGGARAAAWAAAGLALFVLVPTNLNLARLPQPLMSPSVDPSQRWLTGWLGESWVLRHEVVLPPLSGPAPRTWRLTVPLAGTYAGDLPVTLSVNGQTVGRPRTQPAGMEFDIPASLASAGRITLELRESPPDPAVQLVAGRFTAGASAGQTASSYFDGERWWQGTLDTRMGVNRPGVYLLRLEPVP